MKKLLLLIGITVISILSQAQISIPANDKGDIILINSSLKKSKGIPSKDLMDRFPIYKLNGEYYISVLAKTNSVFTKERVAEKGIIFGSKIGDIVSLKIPVNSIESSIQNLGLTYLELGRKVIPNLDKAIKDVRADSVQYGLGLPQSFTGKNVLIGITDWGFDYTHPMFYDTTLTQTRILAAWDQYKLSGPAPIGYSYGTEYATIPDLLAAGSDTANIYSYATHGSHVAGISGGSGAGTVYRGVGFDAQYLFTTFLVDNASVLDAYAWMYEKAQTEQKRLVINMSWGLYYLGTLDGNSLLSQAIDNYSNLGVVFCNSGGNNGGVNFHIKKTFSNDVLLTKVEFYNNPSLTTYWGQSITMWGETGKAFNVKCKVVNASGVVQNESPFYSTTLTTSYVDTFFVVGNDTVFYNVSADAVHPVNGKPQMRFRIATTNTALKIALEATAVDGTVHFWNLAELVNNVGNMGTAFTALNTNYTVGNDSYGISEPSCTNSLISVGAYASEYHGTNGTLLGGAITSFSSKGPTIDGRVKPDIAAPGSNVGSSLSSFTDNSYTLLTSVNFNNRTYPFARFSGTSMSSPVVTGVVTLMLEANPNLSAQQVKDIIMTTARQDIKTGVLPDTGSVIWGFGKIHAWKAVQLALQTQSLSEISHNDFFYAYPNPAKNEIRINYSMEIGKGQIELLNMEGKVVKLIPSITNSIGIEELKSGFYFLRITADGFVHTEKIIKE